MVTALFYFILGIVQGILEWLPVSSEGQLVITSTWLGLNDPELAIRLAFWLHLGTMGSVLYVYRKKWGQIVNLENQDYNFLRKFLIITTIGTAIIGVPIKLILFEKLNWVVISSILLIIIAIALFVTAALLRFSSMNEGIYDIHSLTFTQMLLIGMAQGFSIIPGISRSGVTVAALLLAKVEKSQALEYSFHMSVMATLGAIGLDLLGSIIDHSSLLQGLNFFGILAGIIIAFLLGIATMKFLIEIVRKYDFAIVTFVLGILILIVGLL